RHKNSSTMRFSLILSQILFRTLLMLLRIAQTPHAQGNLFTNKIEDAIYSTKSYASEGQLTSYK
ncbi:hypothetical protein MUO56_01200, partial [Candidatus Bathyarchaeota archaeon]|nr:hypothetical protein [Candidatus Bathyarchaeota archaeon]